MENKLKELKTIQLAKLTELKEQEKNLKELQSELQKIDLKLQNNEKLSEEDTNFIKYLGWLSTLSVTISSLIM